MIEAKIKENESIGEVVSTLRRLDDPLYLKEAVLALNQLYIDSIISGRISNTPPWKGQERTLENLINAGVLAVGSFYRGNSLEWIYQVKEMVFLSGINKWKKSEAGVEYRHLEEFDCTINEWANSVSKCNEIKDVDVIVPIASEGFEPAFLLNYIIKKPFILPLRYSRCKRKDSSVRFPAISPKDWASNQIRGKKVLVVEGTSLTGTSLKKVVGYVAEQKPEKVLFSAVIANEKARQRIEDTNKKKIDKNTFTFELL